MAELGVGVRVRTGWQPALEDEGIALKEGTIKDGPYPPGMIDRDPRDGEWFKVPTQSWNVVLDHDLDTIGWCLPERVLFPIDDDGRIDETDTETSTPSVEEAT